MTELDLEEIARRASGAARAPVSGLHPLPGGLSGITLAGQVGAGGEQRIVIKVAPPGLEPVRNRDVLRQARILRGLAGVPGVVVPAVLFTDKGQPPLFGMSFVEGDSFEPVNSSGPLPAAHELESRGCAAAAMLARLHAVEPPAIGLGDEPAGDLLAEVERWERALDTVDEDLRTGHRGCAQALRLTVPVPVSPCVLHGDWRLGNMICRHERIEVVIDWEIWSVGDPRIDLAWFLATSVSAGNPFATRDAPGMPGRAALLAAYESERGAPVEDLVWFDALVDFKQAATMGLILKRNRRRPDPDPAIEDHAPRVRTLIDAALARLRTPTSRPRMVAAP